MALLAMSMGEHNKPWLSWQGGHECLSIPAVALRNSSMRRAIRTSFRTEIDSMASWSVRLSPRNGSSSVFASSHPWSRRGQTLEPTGPDLLPSLDWELG